MWLLALEAFGAFFLFAFIVWWTMFAGKKNPKQSEKKSAQEPHSAPSKQESPLQD